MPEVPVLRQLVKQIARARSGAFKRTKRAVAVTTTKIRTRARTPPVKVPPRDILRAIDIPDGFFQGYITRRWDAPKSTLYSRICHVLLPQRKPSSHRPLATVECSERMISSVEIASTPTADTQGTCVVVHFPHGRYLFGHVAEGTQRILTERNLGMGKMGNIFLSGPVDWHTTGGLMGLILTLADTLASVQAAAVSLNEDRQARGKLPLPLPTNRVDIHGGRNLAHAIASTRRFIYRRGTPIRTHEIRAPLVGPLRDGSAPDWQDECLQVWYLPLPPTTKAKAQARHDEADADNQLLKEHLVASMFNDNWKLDVLRQQRLSEVSRSAKVFHRDHNNRIQEYKGPWPGQQGCNSDKQVLVREPWPAVQAFPAMLPPTQPSDESLCYIVKTHPRREVECSTSFRDPLKCSALCANN